MRWTAEKFWDERGDVDVTRSPITGGLTPKTTHDLLWFAFSAGAAEAEALTAHPKPGVSTVRVTGLGWATRRALRSALRKHTAASGVRYRVKRLKEKDK